MNIGTRGGKARKLGPSETPEFCAEWEAQRAAGQTAGMTGSREHYARVFAWGQATEWQRVTDLVWEHRGKFASDPAAGAFIDLVLNAPKDKP
jgi:hypothetical protein